MLLTACGTGQRPEPVAVLVGSTVFQRTSPQRRPRLRRHQWAEQCWESYNAGQMHVLLWRNTRSLDSHPDLNGERVERQG